MRIVHVVTRFARGGTEANIRHSIEWERGQGHEVALVVGEESLAECLGALDVETHVIHGFRRSVHPVRDVRAYLRLRQLLRRLGADVVHTHQSKAGALGRLAAPAETIRVHTIHMMSFGAGYGTMSGVQLLVERFCAPRTHVLAAVGEQLVEDYLAAGVGRAEQYLVVRSPVDVERFLAARDEPVASRRALRSAIGADDADTVVISAGALEARKRHDRLVADLAPLLREGDVHLVIAGEGALATALGALAERLGVAHAVHLVGHVADLERWFAASDVYAHAAHTEGVPQVVVQALAAGLPVVAAATDGLREVPGAPIAVIEPDDPGALRTAVRACTTQACEPVPPHALTPWAARSIHGQLGELHARIDESRALPRWQVA